MITATAERLNWIRFVSDFIANIATTSCKNVETLPQKNDLSCFKLLLVTGLWDKILTSLLPPIQSCSSKVWVWSCIASNFDKGWRGDHKHKIMDRPFMPKYGTVSQVLLQLVVEHINLSSTVKPRLTAWQKPPYIFFWKSNPSLIRPPHWYDQIFLGYWWLY